MAAGKVLSFELQALVDKVGLSESIVNFFLKLDFLEPIDIVLIAGDDKSVVEAVRPEMAFLDVSFSFDHARWDDFKSTKF